MAELRDYVYIALAVGVGFGGLYVVTGSWPPVVAVQSNSMMHVNATEYSFGEGDTRAEGVGFGRLGTLDPGDLVLVDGVDSLDEVDTYAGSDGESYGRPGDVVVFRHVGQGADLTVMHRAMAKVTVDGEGTNRTYTVQWTDEWSPPPEQLATCSREPEYTCTFDARGVFLPEIGVYECPSGSGPSRSGGLGSQRCANPQPKPFLGPGLLTKGDNVVTNSGADQAPPRRGQKALNPQPVALEQIRGVARGEVPALGLFKVAFSGSEIHNSRIGEHPYYLRIGNMVAPVDLWVLALGEVGLLSGTPVAVTIGRQLWEGRGRDRAPELATLRSAARERRTR